MATGWTECLALLHRSQEAVVQAFDAARHLLPIPLLGLDTDNGSELLNQEPVTYCEREQITCTRVCCSLSIWRAGGGQGRPVERRMSGPLSRTCSRHLQRTSRIFTQGIAVDREGTGS